MIKAKYNHYKKNNNIWFTEIPITWVIKKLKTHLIRNTGGAWGTDFDEINGRIVLRSTEQNVDGNWIIESPAKRNISKKEFLDTKLEKGDLLITKSSGSSLHIGKTSLVNDYVASLNCSFSNFMQRLRVNKYSEPRFFYYLLNSYIGRQQYDFFSNTTTGLANLSSEIIGNIFFAAPPFKEQQSIADFLDYKTSQIDKLVEQKEKLLKLLELKRIAQITKAVTKGLDPNVKMKSSGIEWLGEVPEHWDVKKIRFACQKVLTGITPPSTGEDFFNEGVTNWFTPSDFKNSFSLKDSNKKLREEAFLENAAKLYPKNCVLLIGIGATLGKVGYCETEFSTNQQIIILIPLKSISYKYLTYVLASFKEILKVISNATTLGILNQEKTKQFVLPVPPFVEQQKICSFLNSESDKINKLTDSVVRAIEKLKEYRTSLITSAVTGKIDVREYKVNNIKDLN